LFFENSENEDLRNKLKIKEQKIEELDEVVDHLKRTIRGNLDIDMQATKNKPPIIERIIEKPVFIEKLVEIHRSKSS
jgi:RNAse (barnase) inhibitor barstar